MDAVDPCDGCAEELGDAFTAVGHTDPIFVCDTCLAVVHRVERLVNAGELEADDAAEAFGRLRWGADDARGARGGDRGAGDLSDVHGGVVLSPTEAPPCAC